LWRKSIGDRDEIRWRSRATGIQNSPNVGRSFSRSGNMSELTHLSDAELDAVNGGRFTISFNFQSNVAEVEQSQTNVNVLTNKTSAGGDQVAIISQHNRN
jgi:hypothetical protein